MRITGLAGLISAISFGVVFVVAFFFASHFWQEQKRPRIGQIKKRSLRSLMRRWVWVGIAAGLIGSLGATVYYLVPNVSIIQVPAKGKAYVVITSKLDTLAAQPIVVYVTIQNTGTVEAIGHVDDVTCSFRDIEPSFLTYIHAESGTFSLLLIRQLPFGTRLRITYWMIGGSNAE